MKVRGGYLKAKVKSTTRQGVFDFKSVPATPRASSAATPSAPERRKGRGGKRPAPRCGGELVETAFSPEHGASALNLNNMTWAKRRGAKHPCVDQAAVTESVVADQSVEQSSSTSVYTVSELNALVRGDLESRGVLWLRGEVSGLKVYPSGHAYFALKDDKAQISAVMFSYARRSLLFELESGMELVVRGKVSLHEPRGTYQIRCDAAEVAGMGSLQKAFEQLKLKLKKEGLFDRKRSLPRFVRHVLVVTSLKTAALRDVLKVFATRNPLVRLTIVPSLVQGDRAAGEIVAAIQKADAVDADALLLCRGGGSLEDLWCFNEERVARAIWASRHVVVSGVGHEVDFTLADFVADHRAPTPSAAAEMLSVDVEHLRERMRALAGALVGHGSRGVKLRSMEVEALYGRLLQGEPGRRVRDCMLKADELYARALRAWALVFRVKGDGVERLREGLLRGGAECVESKRRRVEHCAEVLNSLSPLRVLHRGFAVVQSRDGKVIRGADECKVGEDIKVMLAKGSIGARVIS